MKTLDSTDIRELEFQLTYYTQCTCKVVAHTDYMFDITITTQNRIIFILVLELSYHGHLLLHKLHKLFEQKDTSDIETRIYRAIQIFELLWGD